MQSQSPIAQIEGLLFVAGDEGCLIAVATNNRF